MALIPATLARPIPLVRAQAQAQEQARGPHNAVGKTTSLFMVHSAKDPAIKLHQSFEVAQTLLHVSLASICYIRNLLPDAGFEQRDYAVVPKGTHWAYTDFVEGKPPPAGNQLDSDPGPQKPMKVMILAQNGVTGARKLMSWLDGIFDALRMNVLAGVQLSIILDREKPSNVAESYTFTFKYSDNVGNPGRQLDGISISALTGGPISLKDARSDFGMLIRNLIKLTDPLPDLPPTRFLTVHIFYTSDCPPEYTAPGFRSLHEDTFLFPEDEHWRMMEADVGRVDSGFHNVGLKIAHLVRFANNASKCSIDVPIPSNLEYTKVVSRVKDIEEAHVECSTAGLQRAKEHMKKMMTAAPPNPELFPTQARSPGLDSSTCTDADTDELLGVEQIRGHDKWKSKKRRFDEVAVTQRKSKRLLAAKSAASPLDASQ